MSISLHLFLLQLLYPLLDLWELFLDLLDCPLYLTEPYILLIQHLKSLLAIPRHLIYLLSQLSHSILLYYYLFEHCPTPLLQILIQIFPHLLNRVPELLDLRLSRLIDVPEVVVIRLKPRNLELHHLLLGLHRVYLLLQLPLNQPDLCLVTVNLPVALSKELIVALEAD